MCTSRSQIASAIVGSLSAASSVSEERESPRSAASRSPNAILPAPSDHYAYAKVARRSVRTRRAVSDCVLPFTALLGALKPKDRIRLRLQLLWGESEFPDVELPDVERRSVAQHPGSRGKCTLSVRETDLNIDKFCSEVLESRAVARDVELPAEWNAKPMLQ